MASGGRPEGYSEGREWKARVLSTTATGAVLGVAGGVAAAALGAAPPAVAVAAVTSNCCIAALCVAGLEEAVREVRVSLASDPTNGLLGGALAGALFGRLRGSRDIAIRAAVMFGLAGAGHRAAVESFKEWRIQQLMAARMAEHTAGPDAPHADVVTDRGMGEAEERRAMGTGSGAARSSEAAAACTAASLPSGAAIGAQPEVDEALAGRAVGAGQRGGGREQKEAAGGVVGQREEHAKGGGQWEWPEWLPVRRLSEEEVRKRQEDFRRRVAAAQRLQAVDGGESGMGGAGERGKGE
ncbi:hypothetical protein CLOM_g319 [Closterium sp. NIES-68]|nr:hypothetical protein CLOM_g319 [Closterium sp. NIES-68]